MLEWGVGHVYPLMVLGPVQRTDEAAGCFLDTELHASYHIL